jgi:hypothetical protein
MNVTSLAAAASRSELSLCRLCGGPTRFRYELRLLQKWPVGYWQCESCASLQTDAPFWLAEAYGDVRPVLDTGMVARSLRMAQTTSLLLRVAGIDRSAACLDWGGGNGLFCRLMRDQGYDFRNHDKFAAPYYSVGFGTDDIAERSFEVVTSFEVFEHLADPHAVLAAIAALRPRLWIFSTELYRGQDKSWGYLAPDSGRHVFFYSARGLAGFAEHHGLEFMPGRHLHGFARKEALRPTARRLMRLVLRGGKLAGFVEAAHFTAEERHAHLRWQADREALRATPPQW